MHLHGLEGPGLLEAWFGLQSLALAHKISAQVTFKPSSYKAFWFLNFDARILILISEWSVGRSELPMTIGKSWAGDQIKDLREPSKNQTLVNIKVPSQDL